MKRNDEESNLPEILQRIPEGIMVCAQAEAPCNISYAGLRGIEGRQMNMASEQRTERYGFRHGKETMMV